MSTPFWIDSNILIRIADGKFPGGEAKLAALKNKGHTLLIPKSVEIEVLHGKTTKPGSGAKGGVNVDAIAASTVKRQQLLTRLGVQVDTLASRVPPQQVQKWFDAALKNGLSIPDASVLAQVKAGAQARGIADPVLITREKAADAMRRQGVAAQDIDTFAAQSQARPPTTKAPSTTTPKTPPKAPRVNLRPRFKVVGAGVRGAFSAPNLASMIPEVILAIADRAAVRDAIRKIQIKYIKVGFSLGVAAGVMRWNESEVESNLMNQASAVGLEHMHDPAGYLKRSHMFQLAQTHQDFAVEVGYKYSSQRAPEWKDEVQDKGFALLVKQSYHFGDQNETLFEFPFLDKLAYVLRPTTDLIVGPAIKFK